jgi:hypothetical protein
MKTHTATILSKSKNTDLIYAFHNPLENEPIDRLAGTCNSFDSFHPPHLSGLGSLILWMNITFVDYILEKEKEQFHAVHANKAGNR